ncbi:hypothetical protein V2J09_018449 [Rumex salicifolius]
MLKTQFININPSCNAQSLSLSLWLLALVTVLLIGGGCSTAAEAARAFYVFGDSLVDSGNNNYLATTARADSPPYGIDYPSHRPTGRFSNGLNIPDIISEQIGASESPLPYLSPELNGEKLIVGANFASAGIGVLPDTGIQFLNIIRIDRQFELFEEYQKRLAAQIGADQAKQRVNEALYLIVLGGNDFVNNYFLPFSTRPIQYSLPDYANYVVSEYDKVLTRLYELGARRVMVPGSGPLGCVPSQLASSGSDGECAEQPQRAAALYNPLLLQMIQRLNAKLGSDVFIAANTGKMQKDFITDPKAFGFETSKEACCGQGPNNGVGICNPTSNLCPDRNTYAFWDPFHPTEKANRIIVQQMFTASNEYMHPMNLSTIMALDSRV